MNRLDRLFSYKKHKEEKILVGFLTAGDPNPQLSAENIRAIIDGGVDIIELGVPFSDPMADGPVIQRSSIRALEAGINIDGVIEMAGQIRKTSDAAIVLFSYYNPIFSCGKENFAKKAAEAGIDAVLIVDLPFEEMGEIEPELKKAGLSLIRLIAPTTPPARMKELLKDAEGFVYFVSMTGVTGSAGIEASSVRKSVDMIREFTSIPVCVGFGISTPAQAASISEFADGIVVGSAFERIIEDNQKDDGLPEKLHEFARELKTAICG
jgi:tryptophan synthase alpha chain